MRHAMLLGCLVLMAGCGGDRPREEPKGAGVRAGAANEKGVEKFIIETANDPRSVEFVKWGPHRSAKELAKDLDPIINAKGPGSHDWLLGVPPFSAVDGSGWLRVAFRMRNKLGAVAFYDRVYGVDKKGTVFLVADNPTLGDGWSPLMLDLKKWK